VRRADNLTTFTCQLSGNLGASTSWNPQDLSRPVMGLLYLYLVMSNMTAHGKAFSTMSGYNIFSRFFPLYMLNVGQGI